MSISSKLKRVLTLVAGSAVQRKQTWNLLVLSARGVDLAYVPVEHLGLDEAWSCAYADSGGPELEEVLHALPITTKDAALDLGCGKGGAIFTLAKFFPRVTGVEISRELVAVAEDNIRKLRIRHAVVIHSDAAAFSDLDEYTYLYMFNPFPATVMAHVLENLHASLQRRPRAVTVIYKNPVCDELFRSAGFTLLRTFSHSRQPFYVYGATTS